MPGNAEGEEFLPGTASVASARSPIRLAWVAEHLQRLDMPYHGGFAHCFLGALWNPPKRGTKGRSMQSSLRTCPSECEPGREMLLGTGGQVCEWDKRGPGSAPGAAIAQEEEREARQKCGSATGVSAGGLNFLSSREVLSPTIWEASKDGGVQDAPQPM